MFPVSTDACDNLLCSTCTSPRNPVDGAAETFMTREVSCLPSKTLSSTPVLSTPSIHMVHHSHSTWQQTLGHECVRSFNGTGGTARRVVG